MFPTQGGVVKVEERMINPDLSHSQVDMARYLWQGLKDNTLYSRQAAEDLLELLAKEPPITFVTIGATKAEVLDLIDTKAIDDPVFQRNIRELRAKAIAGGQTATVIALPKTAKRTG